MVLTVDQVDIPICIQVIHDILGFPLGKVDINSFHNNPNQDTTVQTWKKQFTEDNDIRLRGIQSVMSRILYYGLIYKFYFFVLICNTLGKSKSMSACDLSIIDKVSHDLDLSDIDQCSYILQCLNDKKLYRMHSVISITMSGDNVYFYHILMAFSYYFILCIYVI